MNIKNSKVIDCFTYLNEDLILDLRLNTLDSIIDYFVIVEAKHTHQGKKKELNFNIDKYQKFKKKIIYLPIDNININPISEKKNQAKDQNWQREINQRNFILDGIKDFHDEDFIIISDVDEIPDIQNIKKFTKLNKKFGLFAQKFYYYRFNLRNMHRRKWMGSKICRKKDLITPDQLRRKKGYSTWNLKKRLFSDIIILKGGWHFSYIHNCQDIIYKINNFAHTEFNTKHININNVKELIENKKDILGRNIKLKAERLDKSYPKYLIDNKTKYDQFII